MKRSPAPAHLYRGLSVLLLVSPAALGQQTETEAALLFEWPGLSTPQFGTAVEVAGPWAFVGDWGAATLFFYRRDADGWRPAGMDRGPVGSWFGDSVSSDGETLVVGAQLYGWPQSPIGKVRVYELVGDRWMTVQRIDPPDLVRPGASGFGDAVAVDGDVMVIGVPGYDDPIDKAGLILIYERIGGVWVWVARFGQQTLDGPNGKHVALGAEVALSGTIVAASAPGQAGAVYLYERDAAGWHNTGVLHEENSPDDGDGFGRALALSEDGRTLVVGQPDPDYVTFSYLPGRAHVYEKDDQGVWSRVAVLRASDEYIGSDDSSEFGTEVDIDADRVAIGSSNAKGDPAILGYEGAVYLFERTSDGTWPGTETRQWWTSQPDHGGDLGQSVALDGGFLIAGSFDDPAHVFEIGEGAELCPGHLNSTGVPGNLTAVGSPVLADATLTLSARHCPIHRPGLFLASFAQGQTPLGDGVLCLGRPTLRLGGVAPTGRTGTAFHELNFANPAFGGGLGAGTTPHFQYWFSEKVGTGSNLTNAVSVTLE